MVTNAPVTIRRMDPFPFIMMGILVAGTIGGLLMNGVHPIVPIGSFYCIVLLIGVIAYLDGPAAYLVADPARLVVGNSFVRYDVPRSRVTQVSTLELLGLYLVLDDGSKIRLRAYDPAMRGSTSRSPRRSMVRAQQILDAIAIGTGPTGPDGAGPVTRHIRWFSVVLAALPFALFATLIIATRN